MNIYGLYDTKEKERCVGVFKGLRKVGKYIGSSQNVIACAISRNHKLRWRYEIKKVGEVEEGEKLYIE